MSWRTHPLVMQLRRCGRTVGLNQLPGMLLASRGYEDRFNRLMISSIRPGDCVWDVGANIGLYTRKFADLVGKHGSVVAFEPSPRNLEQLRHAVSGYGNVTVLPLALGAREGEVRFQQGEDALGATSRVLDSRKSEGERVVSVRMARGDQLVQSGRASCPNVIKIDTEGFELDVLEGLAGIITQPALRALCIEVHFRLLDDRGLHDAPARIEALLAKANLQHTWPDSSHVVATRERG